MPDRKRRMIDADGELSEDLVAMSEPTYCTHCGTANPSDSRFCRKCGQSLEEQEADMVAYSSARLAKEKNDEQHVAAQKANHTARNSALLQIFTMIFVAGMGITGLIAAGGSSAGNIVFVMLAWFLVEAVRTPARGKITAEYTLMSIITMLFVTGMVITAFIATSGTNSGIAFLVLLAWLFVEAIRASGQASHG